MSTQMTRRQWLGRSGVVLGSAALGSFWSAGKASALFQEKDTSSPLRMLFNENPYAPSEIARQAMREAFNEANLYAFYEGEGAYDELCAIIAQQVGLTPDHILIGSGSTEILRAAALITGLEGGEIISPYPTYDTMNTYAETIGIKVHRVPLADDFHFNLQAMKEKITKKVRLIYLCNPNNPTGLITPHEQFRPFCEELAKEMLVFVDEAYYEYVNDPHYRSMVDMVSEGHQVIVSRTSSKIHGLAGLRIGFGIADPKLVKFLKGRLTGTNNIIGQRAAIASYQDKNFQEFGRQKNNEAKEFVYRLFRKTGRQYLVSQANFVFFHTGMPIKEFGEAMKKHGVLVGRPFPPYLDWCRLSMAKVEEMERFASAFEQVIGYKSVS